MIRRGFRLGFGCFATLIVLIACGDDASLPPDASVVDGSVVDTFPSDASMSRDTSLADGTADGNMDATVDAPLTDASTDAGFDVGPEPDAGPTCDDSLWPTGLRLIRRTYQEVGGLPFGTSPPDDLLVELSNRTVVSLEFTTPETPFRRRLIFEDPPTSHNQVDRDTLFAMTVSDCPGDVTDRAQCFLPLYNRATALLSTRPEDVSVDRFCHLEAGRRYYLNFVASQAPFDTPPMCRDSAIYDSRRCAVFFVEGTL